MQHYILTVKIRVAEVENYLHRLVSVENGETVEDEVHEFMQDYWGEETVTEKEGRHYHREWQESLLIESYQEISEEEYQTMKTYLMEW